MLRRGSRVRCVIPAIGSRIVGTICGQYKNPKTGELGTVLAVDKRSGLFQSYPHLHLSAGTIFVENYIGSLDGMEVLDPSDSNTWSTVPLEIGVHVRESFEHDGVAFPQGTVGRVRNLSGGLCSALWNLDVISRDYDRKYPYLKPWNVPAKYLSFGTVDLEGRSVIVNWGDVFGTDSPLTGTKFKAGDVVTYTSSRSLKMTGKDERTYAMVKGTVLIVVDAERGRIHAALVGSCSSKLVGSIVQIDSASIAPFPFLWIPEGKRVRVSQEINFRKKPLQSQIGVVVTPTDQDGDVGVQFYEDIGAGSLDGLGQDGRCLFIPARALEISG